MKPVSSPLVYLVFVIASLPAAASVRRLQKSWGDAEKLGSSLKVSDEGLVVGTT